MATISPSTTRGVCSGLVPPRPASRLVRARRDTTDAAVPLLVDGESSVVLAAFPCRHTTYRRDTRAGDLTQPLVMARKGQMRTLLRRARHAELRGRLGARG